MDFANPLKEVIARYPFIQTERMDLAPEIAERIRDTPKILNIIPRTPSERTDAMWRADRDATAREYGLSPEVLNIFEKGAHHRQDIQFLTYAYQRLRATNDYAPHLNQGIEDSVKTIEQKFDNNARQVLETICGIVETDIAKAMAPATNVAVVRSAASEEPAKQSGQAFGG